MLQRLLDLVAEGGLRSYADLARELGVSEGLVGQMIEHLAQRGYLRPVAGDCQGRCTGCPLAKTCAVGGPTRVWALAGSLLCETAPGGNREKPVIPETNTH